MLSAESTVRSAQETVEKARRALADTKLYAPAEGVVATVKSSVGESVTGSGTESSSSETSTDTGSSSTGSSGTASTGSGAAGSTASTGSNSSGGSSAGTGSSATGATSGGSTSTETVGSSSTGTSGSGTTGGGTNGSAGSTPEGADATSTADTDGGSYDDIALTSSSDSTTSGTSSSSSSSSSESSSSFIELVDVQGYQLVVPLSESEIGNVHVEQIATVTVEALEGRKFAAQVASVAVLSTSSSGAVSYDVTFQLEQTASGLKPGMSATAEVVIKQAEGVNVPTSAIKGGSVTVERDGKKVTQAVTTGLAGNSTTIVLTGLKAGETVVLPTASSTSSSTSASKSSSGTSGSLGGAGATGGLAAGGGGGFPGGGGGPP